MLSCLVSRGSHAHTHTHTHTTQRSHPHTHARTHTHARADSIDSHMVKTETIHTNKHINTHPHHKQTDCTLTHAHTCTRAHTCTPHYTHTLWSSFLFSLWGGCSGYSCPPVGLRPSAQTIGLVWRQKQAAMATLLYLLRQTMKLFLCFC